MDTFESLTDEEGAELCERIWQLLPENPEDAWAVLAMEIKQFCSMYPQARDGFIHWLEFSRQEEKHGGH